MMADNERRAELPVDLISVLEWVDAEYEELNDRPPLLPASETPPKLVQLAEELVAAFAAVPSNWVRDAFETELRPIIDAALSRNLTERVDPPWNRMLYESPAADMPPELIAAIEGFTAGMNTTDYRTSAGKSRLRRWRLIQKRKAAELHGVKLELTDEEWGEL